MGGIICFVFANEVDRRFRFLQYLEFHSMFKDRICDQAKIEI
jgi:hypothetical protein